MANRRVQVAAFLGLLLAFMVLLAGTPRSPYRDLPAETYRKLLNKVAWETKKKPEPLVPASSPVEQLLQSVYRSRLHPITAPSFTNDDNIKFWLKEGVAPTYTQGLGKRLLILDVDNRPQTDKGLILDPEGLQWHGMQGKGAGMLGHWLYAAIHGYSYKLMVPPTLTERHNTWTKVAMVREALNDYDFVVFMDADVTMPYPTLPLEWLLNHWGHTPDTLLMISGEVPDQPYSLDEAGDPVANSGFFIAQNSSRTIDLFDKWFECPTGGRYPKCTKWKFEHPHEQGALRVVQSGDFPGPRDVVILPCAESDGHPWKPDHIPECVGQLVRHYWESKDRTRDDMVTGIMREVIPMLHGEYRSGKNVETLPRFQYPFP